jgi:uncharacterized membrane protein YhaH (DUF805 family)
MVGFGEAVSRGFRKYFAFSGRATHAEYWWWVLFAVLVRVILRVVDSMTGGYDGYIGPIEVALIGGFFIWATLIPSLSLGARRLHDINRTGWWLLLIFAVLIGWIVLTMWAIGREDRGPNKYGTAPRSATSQ